VKDLWDRRDPRLCRQLQRMDGKRERKAERQVYPGHMNPQSKTVWEPELRNVRSGKDEFYPLFASGCTRRSS
jgi:hypothetical protein